jgi:hypothetical protein
VDLPGQRHHPDQLRRLLLVQAGPADGHGLLLGDPGGRSGDLLGLEGVGVGQELDDLLADPVEAGAELDQHLGGHALALADQPEQDVLGADVVVPELQRLAQRQLPDLLGPGGERDVAAGLLGTPADDLCDLDPDGLQGDVEGLERSGGDPFALVDQPEQDVLGADVVVVEVPGLLLGEHDHPPGPVGETLEHRHRPSRAQPP